MKKITLLLLFVLSSLSFATYSVGDVVSDFSWTDNNGDTHSINEVIASKKALVFFWGDLA